LKEESKMLEEWIREKSKEGGANSWLRSKPVQYLVLILVCLGLLALIWPTGSEQKLAERPGTGLESLDPTQGSKQISQEVASILAKIEGAGKVDVSITLASSGQKSYATNIRQDARESKESNGQGSKSSLEESNTQDIAVSSGNPLLIEEKTPEILGVLVVADGARWPVLREKIANATATLLNVPAYKVQVMPREGGI
jgi:stage III sporulation protein AG